MRQAPVPYAKVTRPYLKGVVPRTRLFRLLDRAREQRVTWVCGPAGCGKTSLVASYLEARRVPVLWYQVDGTDKDSATFFYYMGLAANIASPRRRKPLPLLTPEYLPDLSAFAARYFENLCKRLPAPAVLVFDNIHETDGDSDFYRLLHHGLTRVPHGFTAILISRHKPPPVFGRMLANREMAVVGWEVLRLTQDETREIVRSRAPDVAMRRHLRAFHRAADGWAAGLILLLEWATRINAEPSELHTTTPKEILEYLGHEIFSKLDRHTQRFLLRTAFLPRMTAKMAEEATGLASAGEILSRLSDRNNFTERRFHGEPVYQYHPLFRDFLLAHGKRVFTTANLSAHRRRAAAVLEGAGEADGAAMLLADARDWDALTSLILKHAGSLVAQGRHRVLETWLRRFPGAVVERGPWLQYWKGAAMMPRDPASACGWFERAFSGFKTGGDAAGIFLSWAGTVNAVVYAQEDYATLDGWIGELDNLIARRNEFPSREIAAQVAAAMVTAIVFRQPWRGDIARWASRALTEEAADMFLARLQTWWALAYHGIHVCDSARAVTALDHAVQMARSPGCPPLDRIRVAVAEAAYAELSAERERAVSAAMRGLEMAQREGIHMMDHMLMGFLAAAALDANEGPQARAWLRQMVSLLPAGKPFATSFYHLMKCRDALIRGAVGEALPQSELALKHVEAVGLPIQTSFALVLRARALHALGRDEEAADSLLRAHQRARRTSSRLAEFHALLAESEFCMDRGQGDRLNVLQNTLCLGKDVGYATLLDVPATTTRLCTCALEAGIEVPYVQELIRRRNLAPDDPPYHLEAWPWPLRLHTLGAFRLERDGRPLSVPGKAQKMPLLLLKAIVALGGKDVPGERVSDALWPQADGDAAHSAFTTTLSRLRNLLGMERAIRVKEGRITVDPQHCWVDAWAFEYLLETSLKGLRALRQARDRETTEPPALGALVGKTLALYQGHFLPADEAHVWTASYRERLRVKFLRLIGRWGEHLEWVEKHKDAIEAYQRGLEVDELTEEFYQRLMLCYQRLGLRAEALSAYDRCQEVLSTSLGVSPSQKTDALYRSLQT